MILSTKTNPSIKRTLSVAVLSVAGAALIGGALTYAPLGQADPGGDNAPACIAEGTCARLIPKAEPKYLPLTPAPRSALLTPAPAAR